MLTSCYGAGRFDVFRKGFLIASDLSLRFDQVGPQVLLRRSCTES